MMTVRDFEDARIAVAMLRAHDALPWWALIRRRRIMARARRIVRIMQAREME